jgi:hypothetical protein
VHIAAGFGAAELMVAPFALVSFVVLTLGHDINVVEHIARRLPSISSRGGGADGKPLGSSRTMDKDNMIL